MAITTETVAARLAARLAEFGVELSDAEGFATAFAGDLVEWTGGAEAVPVALASKFTTLGVNWNTAIMQELDWSAGTVDGGPEGDGRYPKTNAAGVTELVPCIAKLMDSTAKGNAGWTAKSVIEPDGPTRAVLRILDWTGGEGTKPATGYVAADGSLVGTAAAAADVFGEISTTLNEIKTDAQTAEMGAVLARAALDFMLALSDPSGDGTFVVRDRRGEIGARMAGDGFSVAQLNAQAASVAKLLATSLTTAGVSFEASQSNALELKDRRGEVLAKIDLAGLANFMSVVASQVSAAKVTAGSVELSNTSGGALEVKDRRSNVLARLGFDGVLQLLSLLADVVTAKSVTAETGNLTTLNLGAVSLSVGTDALAVLDRRGNILARLADDSFLEVVGIRAKSAAIDNINAPVTWPGESQHDELNHIVSLGQSNSCYAYPARTTAVANALMLSTAGLNTYNKSTSDYRSALVAANQTSQPIGGVLQALQNRFAAGDPTIVDPAEYRLLGSAPSTGGTSMSFSQDLIDNANSRPWLHLDIDAAKALAAANGWRYAIKAVVYTQGESESNHQLPNRAGYAAGLSHMQQSATALAKSKTGQVDQVPLIISQISSFNHALVADYPSNAADPWVSLAQFDAVNVDSRVLLACPTYMFDFDNPEHYDERGHRIIGHYYGLVYETVVLRGQQWKHIRPISSGRTGSAVYVRYQVPAGPLVLDTSWVSDPGNYGFQIFQSAAGPEMTITSVELLQGDTVKIVCSATIPAGAVLRYGFKYSGDGSVYGRTGGPRGNLRDSAGAARVFAVGDGLGDWAAHNYCPIHDHILS